MRIAISATASGGELSSVPGLVSFIHDLRHTGNQLAAATGATLRELMDRMGNSTARAALIYLHGSDQRQQEIAQALSDLAKAELARRGKRPKAGPARKASDAPMFVTYRAWGGRNAS